MPSKSIYPSIPAPGNTPESQRATLDAIRQTMTMVILNAQAPSANYAPSSAAQVFVTQDQLKATGVVGPSGPAGPQGPPGPGIAEAPNDTSTYGRHALTWQPVVSAASPVFNPLPPNFANDAAAAAGACQSAGVSKWFGFMVRVT